MKVLVGLWFWASVIIYVVLIFSDNPTDKIEDSTILEAHLDSEVNADGYSRDEAEKFFWMSNRNLDERTKEILDTPIIDLLEDSDKLNSFHFSEEEFTRNEDTYVIVKISIDHKVLGDKEFSFVTTDKSYFPPSFTNTIAAPDVLNLANVL